MATNTIDTSLPLSQKLEGSDLVKAQAALTSSIRYAKEPQSTGIIDALLEGTQSQSTDTMRSEALVILSAVKSQLGTFAQASSAITMALEELGKIHPFIQIAVIPFKVAVTFELQRRENDKKVLALFVQMSDMMDKLRLLSRIKPSELDDGKALAGRMEGRLKEAADAIQKCSHATNDYYKAKFLAKLVKCGKWEGKFAGYAKAFANFAIDFQSDLQIYISTGVQILNRVTGRVDEKIDMLIKLVFETLLSPDELELNKFIGSNGGPDKFMENDRLLKDLMEKRKDQLKRSPSFSPQGQIASQLEGDRFKELKEELKTNLDSSLDESRKLFDQKFKEQSHQFEEVKNVVTRESDRIIKQIRSGAHNRVIDKVMHHIWMDMSWKGSIKARHLVLALRDYYIDRLHHLASTGKAISEIKTISDNANSESHSDNPQEINEWMDQTAPEITDDDRWAIGYISIFRLRPLLEALDTDYSGLVTVSEVNEFTAARPEDWTLPRWLAYWTVGFHVTLKQYCGRIREVFSALASTQSNLLPGNAGVCSRFMYGQVLVIVDRLVAGIHITDSDHGDEDEYQHSSFKDYVDNNEKRLRRNLKSYEYCIDDINTMTLITGPARLEEHVVILIYLVLRQALRIMERGKSNLLPLDAFENVMTSLRTIWWAVIDRTRTLQGASKLQNFVVQDELRKYCHGLDPQYYYFVFSNEMYGTGYYNMPGSEARHLIDTDGSKDDEPETTEETTEKGSSSPLKPELSRSDIDLLDIRAYEEATNPNPTLESEGLVGEWNGFNYYGSEDAGSMIGFWIEKVDVDGSLEGRGSDEAGYFTFTGTFTNSHLSFTQEYFPPRDRKWSYNGEVSEDCDDITGRLGPLVEKREEIDGPEGEPEFIGTFKVQRRSLAYMRFHPSNKAFQKNKPRALWKFALDSTLHEMSNGRLRLRWPALKTRRDQRQKFISLHMEWEDNGLDDEEAEEYNELRKSFLSADLRYYLSLAKLVRGREVVHAGSGWTITCDNCSKLMKMTRYICIDCWEPLHGADSVDLCTDCVDKEFTVTRDNGAQQLKHILTHSLLQVRRPLQMRQSYAAREKARNAENIAREKEREGSALHCVMCRGKVERPYWSCGDCYQTFICMSCNKETERTRPWVFERRYTKEILRDEQHSEGNGGDAAVGVETQSTTGENGGNNGFDKGEDNTVDLNTDNLEAAAGSQNSEIEVDHATSIAASPPDHHWSHDLILCQPTVPMMAAVTVEERLVKLETTISAGVKDMTSRLAKMEDLPSRLERLEDLLSRLVGGST